MRKEIALAAAVGFVCVMETRVESLPTMFTNRKKTSICTNKSKTFEGAGWLRDYGGYGGRGSRGLDDNCAAPARDCLPIELRTETRPHQGIFRAHVEWNAIMPQLIATFFERLMLLLSSPL
ncbi:unnamed protein product [Colias eurytheme]|nr:unnamed protein product [Colias eurytheme]